METEGEEKEKERVGVDGVQGLTLWVKQDWMKKTPTV